MWLKSYFLPSEYTEVRLMKNGTSQCEGQVEMNISGEWRTLCASHWSMANANVVCHQLSCGVAISTPKETYFVEGGDQVWKAQFHCSGAESFLWNCPVTALGIPDCTHGNTASVICSGKREGGANWYLGCSLSEMSLRAESVEKLASKVRYFMVRYGSSHCSFVFQVKARSVKRNKIF